MYHRSIDARADRADRRRETARFCKRDVTCTLNPESITAFRSEEVAWGFVPATDSSEDAERPMALATVACANGWHSCGDCD